MQYKIANKYLLVVLQYITKNLFFVSCFYFFNKTKRKQQQTFCLTDSRTASPISIHKIAQLFIGIKQKTIYIIYIYKYMEDDG